MTKSTHQVIVKSKSLQDKNPAFELVFDAPKCKIPDLIGKRHDFDLDTIEDKLMIADIRRHSVQADRSSFATNHNNQISLINAKKMSLDSNFRENTQRKIHSTLENADKKHVTMLKDYKKKISSHIQHVHEIAKDDSLSPFAATRMRKMIPEKHPELQHAIQQRLSVALDEKLNALTKTDGVDITDIKNMELDENVENTKAKLMKEIDYSTEVMKINNDLNMKLHMERRSSWLNSVSEKQKKHMEHVKEIVESKKLNQKLEINQVM